MSLKRSIAHESPMIEQGWPRLACGSEGMPDV